MSTQDNRKARGTMTQPSSAIRLLWILSVTVGLLNGCAPTSGIGTSSSASYAVAGDSENTVVSLSTPSLAVTPYGRGHEIDLFDSDYNQYKTVVWKSGPVGGGSLAFDRKGNLYLADSGTPYAVGDKLFIFSPPYSAPPQVVSVGPNHVAFGIALDQKTGVFAILAAPGNQYYSSQVLFYLQGQSTPCATVKFPIGTNFEASEAFDAQGNLFLAEFTGGGYVKFISIAGECKAQAPLVYNPQFVNTISDFQFNPSDQFVVDFNYPAGIQTFAHPQNGTFGQPLHITILNKANGAYVAMGGLSADGKTIFAIPYFKRNVYLYHYPAGGAPYKTIITDSKEGNLAVNPPGIP